MVNSLPNSTPESTSSNKEQQENLKTNSNVALEVSASSVRVERIYIPSAVGTLRQGEILSNITQVKIKVESLRNGKPEAVQILHPFVIVMSQDCDCEQDYHCRKNDTPAEKKIPNILFCEVITARELRDYDKRDMNSTIWNQVKINKNERYQFLQSALPEDDAAGEGLPELGIDFKRYFSIPTDEVYYRIEINEAKRRCRLASPYMEHLASRFSYFMSRIALPSDHSSDKETGG